MVQQAHIRLGDDYVYGGFYSPFDIGQGADCSGVVGWVLEALTKDPQHIRWAHLVSTESWYYDYNDGSPALPGSVGPYGTIAVGDLSDIPPDAALTVNIMHGGGGEDSHTNCIVPTPGSLPYEGIIVESNGNAGSCTNGTGGNPAVARLWTDHWYLPGPWIINEPPGLPAQPQPQKGTYTVQPGDTMSAIAERHGVTLDALERANPAIPNPNSIYIGQVVIIP